MDTIAHQAPRRPRRQTQDAVALLKADHRQVKNWFQEFKRAHTLHQKQELATRICEALTVHTQLEEEIFYPAFLLATQDRAFHHEAIVEHEAAETLIARIRERNGQDEYFEAMVLVLADMIDHHVKLEERPGGLFAIARKSSMDLATLGRTMLHRKGELQDAGHLTA